MSQFFVEKNDKNLKGFKGIPQHLSGNLCRPTTSRCMDT